MTQDFTVTSPPELCIVYSILLALGNLIGIIGNILVIAATFNKNGTFKLDLGTVVFLRHLALSDVLFVVLYPAPMSLTYAMRRWVYGELACKIVGQIISVPVLANINFILALSIHRLVRCKYPQRVHKLTPKLSNIMCIIIWSCSCLLITVTLKMESRFNGKLATCTFSYPKSTANKILIMVTTTVPFLLIVTSNVLLWLHVRQFNKHLSSHRTSVIKTKSTPAKGREKLKRMLSLNKSMSSSNKAVVTTTAITALFALTWMPTVVRFNYSAFFGEEGIPAWVEQLRYLYFIGSWGNPILYSTINRGFREYLKKFCMRLCRIYIVQPGMRVSAGVSQNLKKRRQSASGAEQGSSRVPDDLQDDTADKLVDSICEDDNIKTDSDIEREQ